MTRGGDRGVLTFGFDLRRVGTRGRDDFDDLDVLMTFIVAAEDIVNISARKGGVPTTVPMIVRTDRVDRKGKMIFSSYL